MGFFQDVGSFLFGKGDKVLPPYESPEAKKWKEMLGSYGEKALGTYDPTQGSATNQGAFNNYNGYMTGLMGGKLPQGYSDQLGAIRDNNLKLAQNQIGEAANTQVGGLLSGLANRGVINSSVMSDSTGQIGKSAANAMSNAALQENTNYNRNYMNGLGMMGNMANQMFGNTLNYTNNAQNMALNPLQTLYGQEISKQPIVQQGSSGLLGTVAGGFASGLGQGLGRGFF